MAFGKKKKFARVIRPEEEEEPQEIEEVEESYVPKPIPRQTREIKEIVEASPVKEKNMAMIVSAEVIEGMRIRTIIVSNGVLGMVGESFEVGED